MPKDPPMMISEALLHHPYAFDPSYGYSLQQLLQVEAPNPCPDFESYWRNCYKEAMRVKPKPRLIDTGKNYNGFQIFDIYYQSTNGVEIGGWLLIPESGRVKRSLVVMHGYGGREKPDYHLPLKNTAMLFPCARGISRSPCPPISSFPDWHVLHDIDKPKQYVLRGCVEDIWLGVSSLIRLFPQTSGRTGFAGISFGGGTGSIACAFDQRIGKAHFNVPTFGHQPLRITLPTTGSGESVRNFHQNNKEVTFNTLRYYDAAIAARFINIPVHFACAQFDPMVAPPGQFAIYNAIKSEKQLYVLEAGHFDYPTKRVQETILTKQLETFFSDL